ncbi:nucleotidyltransferase [Hymenobacter setariae]|uniref:Nucleotidyltransferase n=1 Tax=Hymenobacter setariae TaxID=2594794 RepID=A0A558BMA7_9BACT|nr:nucleotidyltransferase [Hymenobacter setariae]TVT37647.1 nucleotidyltransferase [Hymenobacter setariae]
MKNTKPASLPSPSGPTTSPRTLLVLAGGLGSRYGSLKQIDGITPHGESILEFSVYDALAAGFTKFVFIINPRIPAAFIERLSAVLAQRQAQAHWVVQDPAVGVLPGLAFPERRKPWGTGHAILCAQEVIAEPFTVINADDFYGREMYPLALRALAEVDATTYQLMAFPVAATLSEQGVVSRGICQVDKDGMLLRITEQHSLQSENGHIVYVEDGQQRELPPDWPVSMNCWVFDLSVFGHLRTLFEQFLRAAPAPDGEFYIPTAVQTMLAAGTVRVQVQLSPSRWMGVTYAGDKEKLVAFVQQEIDRHRYPAPLWT